MTIIEEPQQNLESYSIPVQGKLDPILGRIDLVAILSAMLGVCLLAVAAIVMTMIELARLITSLCSDSLDRWLIIVLGLAIVWLAARRKKLCVL
jgi:hypothetical protein